MRNKAGQRLPGRIWKASQYPFRRKYTPGFMYARRFARFKETHGTPACKGSSGYPEQIGQRPYPEEEAKVKDRGFRYYFEMRGVTSRVQVQALDYLVYGDKKQARSAITAMLDTLQNVNYGTKGDLSRASGVDAHLRCNGI